MQNLEVMGVIYVKFMSNFRRAQRALSPCMSEITCRITSEKNLRAKITSRSHPCRICRGIQVYHAWVYTRCAGTANKAPVCNAPAMWLIVAPALALPMLAGVDEPLPLLGPGCPYSDLKALCGTTPC